MESIFVLLAIVVGLPVLAIIFVSNQIQSAKERASVYQGRFDESRAAFLSDAFDLEADELRRLCFDGYRFHFWGQPTYDQIESITVTNYANVTVRNANTPHTMTWLHTRVDGGPDRRFSSNPTTMVSRRFDLVVSERVGDSHSIVAYGYPFSNSLLETVRKFNELLSAVDAIDSEAMYRDYKAAYDSAASARSSLAAAECKQAELATLFSASKRLLAEDSADDGLVRKYNGISNALLTAKGDALKLRMQIAAATEEMADIVRRTQRGINRHRDLKIVESFGGELANQEM